jgi:arylsulfatase
MILLNALGCRQPPERPTEAFVFVDHVEEADHDYDEIQFRSVRKDELLSSQVTMESKTKRSFTPPVPSRFTFTVNVPTDPVLRFSIGATSFGKEALPVPIEFSIYLDSGEGDTLHFSETVFRRHPDRWFDHEIDLTPWSGRRIRLTFATRARPRQPVPHPPLLPYPVMAAWGHPILTSTRFEPDKTPIILISIDCLRADHVGVYGYPRATTPHIDKVAEVASIFDTAIGTSSWTLPTHMSMLTGLMPSFHAATKWEKLDTSVAYLPEVLAEGGYGTHGVASWVYVSQTYGFERGFDIYTVFDNPRAGEVIDEAIALIERATGQNLFLFIHILDPHWPYSPPRDFLEHFGPRPRDLSNLHDRVARAEPPKSDREIEEIIQLYDSEIAYTDQELGRFFEELRARDLYDRSLIIITADHGEAFYEHGHWQHSRTLYDELVHIPLIVKWPEQTTRGRVSAPVSQMDIFPTIIEAAGLELPHRERRGLADYAHGRTGDEGEPISSEVTWRSPEETKMKLSFRDGGQKYVTTLIGPVGSDLGVSHRLEEELYDLSSDPGEMKNLFSASSPEGEAYRQRVRAFLEAAREVRGTRSGEQIELDEKLLERLKALGYVDHY